MPHYLFLESKWLKSLAGIVGKGSPCRNSNSVRDSEGNNKPNPEGSKSPTWIEMSVHGPFEKLNFSPVPM